MPIKVMVMVKRKPSLTPEQFREGYEESHSRIAVSLFGDLWLSYTRNYLIEGRRFEEGAAGRIGGPAELHYDAVSEYVLRDEAAAEEMARIANANWDLIKEDEALWFDQVHCWTVSTETMNEDLTAPRPELRRWADRVSARA